MSEDELSQKIQRKQGVRNKGQGVRIYLIKITQKMREGVRL